MQLQMKLRHFQQKIPENQSLQVYIRYKKIHLVNNSKHINITEKQTSK